MCVWPPDFLALLFQLLFLARRHADRENYFFVVALVRDSAQSPGIYSKGSAILGDQGWNMTLKHTGNETYLRDNSPPEERKGVCVGVIRKFW